MSKAVNPSYFSYEIAQLKNVIEASIAQPVITWLETKTEKIIAEDSSKELYLTYSILASKLSVEEEPVYSEENNLTKYLKDRKANQLEIGRLYLLVRVLEAKEAFFVNPVLNIIQIADKEELITFLKYLILLPGAERFKPSAVEALRTNIATVFDAIAMNNPYPQLYFNDQEWNQMYLKAVFIQRKLEDIIGVDERANKDLARIISDYAHERWAASRTIEPYFWRPVAKFLDETLLADMERLLKSRNVAENRVAALCCYYSDNPLAKTLMLNYPVLQHQITANKINWDTLN